jgi:hypothetical protein
MEIAKLNLSLDMYGRKREDGKLKTFSEVLEEMDPSPEGSTLDAFERQLKARGIFTKDVPEVGLKASTVETFFLTDDNKTLFPEWVNRNIRTAFANNNILNALIGATTIVDTDLYKATYLDRPDRKKTKMRRITEATELPKSKIGLREHMVRFFKYGRAAEASYEAIRRMTLPMLARLMQFIGSDAALDKAEEAIYTLVKGDGNDNAAPVVTITSLGSNPTDGLTDEAWLRFLMMFEVFGCNTLVATKDAFIDFVLLKFPNLTAAQVLSMMVNGNLSSVQIAAPQLPNGNQTVLWHADIADADFTGKKVLGFNREAGIEQLIEQGSTISEAQRFILNQTQVLTLSENTGFSKMFKESTYLLDLDA